MFQPDLREYPVTEAPISPLRRRMMGRMTGRLRLRATTSGFSDPQRGEHAAILYVPRSAGQPVNRPTNLPLEPAVPNRQHVRATVARTPADDNLMQAERKVMERGRFCFVAWCFAAALWLLTGPENAWPLILARSATLTMPAIINGPFFDPPPPVTTPGLLTVPASAGATPIRIYAPSDPNYSASQLSVRVDALPYGGRVTLSDGVTPVRIHETLTVGQLTSQIGRAHV